MATSRRMAGKLGQRFEGLRRNAAGEKLVEIQFGEQNGVAQIVLTGQRGGKLADFAQRQFAQVDGGGFKIQERPGSLARRVKHAAQAELVKEFLQRAFQIENSRSGRRDPRRPNTTAGARR